MQRGCIYYLMASNISPKLCMKTTFLSLTCDEVQILLLYFSPVNATHTIFKALRSTYENSCCLEWISVFKQTVFVIIGVLLFFKSCLFAEFVYDEEKEEERASERGGRAVMEHLISCSLWEPLRHRDARGSVILRVC